MAVHEGRLVMTGRPKARALASMLQPPFERRPRVWVEGVAGAPPEAPGRFEACGHVAAGNRPADDDDSQDNPTDGVAHQSRPDESLTCSGATGDGRRVCDNCGPGDDRTFGNGCTTNDDRALGDRSPAGWKTRGSRHEPLAERCSTRHDSAFGNR